MNRNSASALASSVFPTPVVPMNRKDPIGRFSFWRPARLLRTASETAAIAWSWPTTLLWSSDSILRSFSLSLSSILLTGIPVHFATTSAISSGVTASVMIGSLMKVLLCKIFFHFVLFHIKNLTFVLSKKTIT